MNRFRNRLKELLAYKNLNVYKLSDLTKIPRQTLSEYLSESKPTEPGYNVLDLLSRHLEISPGYFFSDIPVERYYKIYNATKKVTSKLAMMPDDELEVFHKVFSVYAKHLAGKLIEEEEFA